VISPPRRRQRRLETAALVGVILATVLVMLSLAALAVTLVVGLWL